MGGRLMSTKKLSDKDVAVLSLIAEGHSYQQIMDCHPDITYKDIFAAAAEALKLARRRSSDYHERLARIRRQAPRAYTPWTEEDDDKLVRFQRTGVPIAEIARKLQRQVSAVQSRLRKKGLADE